MRYVQQIKIDKKIKLDIKDKKILCLLAENARYPCTYIAKKIGLSRDAVSYRINNFTKKGVIQGYRTIIDINKFGYDAYHIFLQLNQPTKEAEKILLNKFKKYAFMRAIIKFSGNYDLELAVIAKNIKDFDNILNTVLSDCSEYLQNYEILVITKNYVQKTFPKSFIQYNESKKTIKTSKEIPFNIDHKDEQILKDLAEDASLPLYKLAEKTGLSADAINYRIKKMIKQRVIQRFIPVINYSAIYYDVYTILISIPSLTREKEIKLKQILNTDTNMLWAVKTIGKYNLLMYVCAKNSEELHETLINLRNNFPQDIKNYETLIAYEEYKYTYFPEYVYI